MAVPCHEEKEFNAIPKSILAVSVTVLTTQFAGNSSAQDDAFGCTGVH